MTRRLVLPARARVYGAIRNAVVIAATLAAFAASSARAQNDSSTTTVTARVTNASRQAVEGAVVYLRRGAEIYAVDTSDRNGEVAFINVPDETYTLSAQYLSPGHKGLAVVAVSHYTPPSVQAEPSATGVLPSAGAMHVSAQVDQGSDVSSPASPAEADLQLPQPRPLLGLPAATTRVYYVSARRPNASDPTDLSDDFDARSPMNAGYCDVENASPKRFSCQVLPSVDDAIASVKAAAAAATSQQVILYTHGFNNNHADAVRGAAELASATGRAVIAYDWASAKFIGSYTVDEDRIAGSLTVHGHLFAEKVLTTVGWPSVCFMGHSLGARATLQFLMLAADPLLNPTSLKIPAAAFFAGDEYQETFLGAIPVITAESSLVMNFESDHDLALLASNALHSGNRRIGFASPAVFAVPGVLTVDASRAGTDIYGHGYFTNPKIGADVNALLDHADPATLGLQHNTDPEYWIF